MMQSHRLSALSQALAAALPALFPALYLAAYLSPAAAQTPGEPPLKSLGSVTVTSGRPTSLPAQVPTTIEGITREQIQATINAMDSEDALKYLPSLNVRKRYIGDYNHAVLASRATGTDRSARALVFADGIPLSNLLGNGANFTPRWGLVTPQEIDRVDVLYGPYSAAYSGNSVGAVVDYQTRMPKSFEAHAQLGFVTSDFKHYGTNASYSGNQASASLGSKTGDWSWLLSIDRLDNNGQPLVFPAKLVSAGTAGAAGTPVSGAIADKNPQNADWLILGSTTQYQTVQQNAKLKLAYDISPTLRASYILGWWGNNATSNGESYLRDAAGNAVYSGNVNINGRQYAVGSTEISTNRNQLEHVIQGLSLKSNAKGVFDWEVAGSLYAYSKDEARAPTVALPAALNGGAGRVTDLNGTGWNTLALKGIWRPQANQGSAADSGASSHVVDFGIQQEIYQLRTLVSDTSNWISGSAGARFSAFNGNTSLNSAYVQDHWNFAANWNATLGVRFEQWRAFGGEIGNAAGVLSLNERTETAVSPKFAIADQLNPDWVVKMATGRAVRMPTVAELYQGTVSANAVVNNDPNLKPERSWSTELSAERTVGKGVWRTTLFHEDTQDALYSQTNFSVTPTVTNIQNVDRISTIGLEMAYSAQDVGIKGLDLSGSLTFADAKLTENLKNPASVGKRAPRVPDWRASFVASYKPSAKLSTTLGMRYSGQQFSQLDNSDTNGFTYQGVSSYFVADVRVNYQFGKHWAGSVGIDNLTNATYWAFHPYTQRTFSASLKFDL